MTSFMKRITVICAVIGFGLISSACQTASPSKDQGSSVKKAMQDRVKWMTSMNESLEKGDFKMIIKDATSMADQTRDMADMMENEDAIILTTQIGVFSVEIMTFAESENSDSIKDRLGKIKATCSECHQQFRN